MKSGSIDMSMVTDKYKYLIVYSNPDTPDIVNTWVLPASSFRINYESMVKRGVIIRNIYKRMTTEEILEDIFKI